MGWNNHVFRNGPTTQGNLIGLVDSKASRLYLVIVRSYLVLCNYRTLPEISEEWVYRDIRWRFIEIGVDWCRLVQRDLLKYFVPRIFIS